MEANDTRAARPSTDEEVDRVVAAGPHGAVAVAGVGRLIVMARWLAF